MFMRCWSSSIASAFRLRLEAGARPDMSEPDLVYWRRRYWEECRNADRAHTPEVRVFHSRLAQAYGDRLLERPRRRSGSPAASGG
jgi:hypothetical protein